MEKHISDSFYNYLTDNQLLCSDHSGFQPLHSCQTVLVNIVNEFNVAMNQGNMIGCVAADPRKAFNVISHEILQKKMQMYMHGCKRTCLNWFQSYLSERGQNVYYEKTINSDVTFSGQGIPQGSILGPLCFSLYVNDMPQIMQNVQVCMYADDTTLFCVGECKDS